MVEETISAPTAAVEPPTDASSTTPEVGVLQARQDLSFELSTTGISSGDVFIAATGDYVGSGTAPADTAVTMWWNNPDFDGQWRILGSASAAANGQYRITPPTGSWSATYRFTTTLGAVPTSDSTVRSVRIRDTTFALGTTGETRNGDYVAGSGSYVGTGVARPGSVVTMWWNNPAYDGQWRALNTTRAAADGTFRIQSSIGLWLATYRFTTSTGGIPGSFDPAPLQVNVVSAALPLEVSSTGHRQGLTFVAGSGSYVFSGTTDPGREIQVWWNNPNYDTVWRPYVRTTAAANGSYSASSPVGPWVETYLWVATHGVEPVGSGGAVTTQIIKSPSTLNLSTTGDRYGPFFRAGSGEYVYTGRALPGSPVQIWWNNPNYDSAWRPMANTTANTQGDYRVTAAIGPWAATYRFAATFGALPDQYTISAVEVTLVAGMDPETRSVTASELGASWRSSCPVGPGQLTALSMNHWTPAGSIARGTIIIRSDLASPTIAIFQAAYTRQFPMAKMLPAAAYVGNDVNMMADDNTSAFNCRQVVGNPYRLSPHSYGNSFDINPRKNPYYAAGRWYPSSQYATGRSASIPGMHMSTTVFPVEFKSRGGHWGNCYSDFHHFELERVRC